MTAVAPTTPTPGRSRWARLRGAALAALLLVPALGAPVSKEYDVKAVFLYNFATFVDWPDNAAPPPGKPFVIGVLGEDPFGPTLAEVVHGESVRGAPLEVRHFQNVAEARDCRILFVSNSERARLREVFAALRDRPVLTVGDDPSFVDAGGMVAFSTGAHVELVVNVRPARAAGLTISSKLLRVARTARGGEVP